MSQVDDTPLSTALTVSIEERLLAPLRRSSFAARTWFLVAVALVLAAHLALFGYLLTRDSKAELKVAKQDETPVEIVVEKPPEPPKPPPPPAQKPKPPKPVAKQELEKPASSAPRAPNEEKVETTKLEKETHAPKAATPPADGKPEHTADASSPETDPSRKDDADEAAKKEPDTLQKDAEALDKLTPPPKRKPEKVAKAKPTTKTRRAKTAMQQLAGMSNLPDYAFARPTKKSPIYGGSEDSRYLAIVYAMIESKRRPLVVADDNSTVTVAFEVDDEGNVIGVDVSAASGYPTLDAEAVAAIRRASPFPPPPAGAPHGLVATMDFAHLPSAYRTGAR